MKHILSQEQISGDFYSRRFEENREEETLILNMGPQHPSTHGVLRVILSLDGEYIMRAEPVLGYLHRMHPLLWHCVFSGRMRSCFQPLHRLLLRCGEKFNQPFSRR